MRFCTFCAIVLAFLGTGFAQDPATIDEPGVRRAQAELEKIQGLVSTGVLPRAQLEKAQNALAEAKDDAAIRASLYQKDITVDQADGLVGLTAKRVERRQQAANERKKLLDAGIIAKNEMGELVSGLDQAKRDYEWAKNRAQLARELAEIASNEQQIMRQMEKAASAQTPAGNLVEHFVGSNQFDLKQLGGIEKAFESRFAHPLPVSAMGETAVHRSLGFDHRNRVDVALQPNQPEGQWLRKYLTAHNIPFYAFSGAVAHKATGAHIHIGPPSLRFIAQAPHSASRGIAGGI